MVGYTHWVSFEWINQTQTKFFGLDFKFKIDGLGSFLVLLLM